MRKMGNAESDEVWKQYEAVIRVMEENGGYATLGYLNQHVLKIKDCDWNTKTPFASIRRIVQEPKYFFKIRPGLWALETYKNRLPEHVSSTSNQPKEKCLEYTHAYFQGLLVELGNLNNFSTFVPNQDKNKPFLNKKLSDITTISNILEFSYTHMVATAQTVDVSWFNDRDMPANFFEVEHSTDMRNSLSKFVELQDFNTFFCIVADANRIREFNSRISLQAFKSIKNRVHFWDYNNVAELHSKTSALVVIKAKLG